MAARERVRIGPVIDRRVFSIPAEEWRAVGTIVRKVLPATRGPDI